MHTSSSEAGSIKAGSSSRTWVRVALAVLLTLTWLAVAGIGGPYFGKISEVSTNSQTDFLPASAESTQVVEQQGDFLGTDAVPAILVFEADGSLTDAHRTYLEGLTGQLAASGTFTGESSPVIYSEDGRAAELILPISTDQETRTVVDNIRSEITQAPDGLTGYVTGPAGFSADLVEAFGGIDGILLAVALIVVFVILLVVYRSPLLPIIVLTSSMVALSGAIFVIWHMANAGWVMINGQVQGILLILVVGAATDYSLLYVARYREALTQYVSRWDATRAAWRGSLEPILASGGTVIAGLLCLLLSELSSNKALGPVAATGIVLSMLASLTFLPAVLALLGRVAFWPARPRYSSEVKDASAGFWAKIAAFVSARPRKVWLVTALVLAIFAGFSATFQADGVRQSDLVLGESQARDGQNVLAEHFPGGSGSPANVITPASEQDDAVAALDALDGVSSIAAVAQDSPAGTVPVGASAESVPPVFAAVTPTEVDGRVMLQVTLADPADSPQAEETVRQMRESLASAAPGSLVGGTTASALDTIDSAQRDRALIIPVVLVVIALILMVLLRSILAPLMLVAATVLSYLTALGVSALVFNHVFNFPGADPTVPLYGFVFLVALGIDYTIFLMTRVREEALHQGTEQGLRTALIATGGVITSAGIVLAATFAALGVIPLIFLAQLAFIVAFGVLLDATVVRALLIPALVEDIGKKIWWPSKLSR
ncbi:MMPL family transporter [Rothia nasimurium]|uniref:MMPL family transporter n=1 Tax=Rothia nasimurium TaxID=85336 RepID=UPI001F02A95C|nr:efflux RND transporter permease subunit [Rothia nasimurium]